MYPRSCPMCRLYFVHAKAFFTHFVLDLGKDTRCMSVEELEAHGFQELDGVWWPWMDRWEAFWDDDRYTWGALFKPGMMFEDMFPKKLPMPEVSRWRRLLEEAFYGTLSGLPKAWKG